MATISEVVEELNKRFGLVCRKCGGLNVVISSTDSEDFGGYTGVQPGSIYAGCNDCKNNDFYDWVEC